MTIAFEETSAEEFFEGYVEAMLFAETDNADECGGEPLNANYEEEDIDDASLVKMRNDCADFTKLVRDAFPVMPEHEDYEPIRAGHDFWFTRNGHGVGYWDRGLGKFGDELTKLAKTMGTCNALVGDDKRIYVVS